MKKYMCIFFLFLSSTLFAQERYFSKTAQISFDADGSLDDIEEIKAKNSKATCVYDATTGQFEWSVTIKDFVFANSLMQEHFNENYMESEKYPKASFKGKVQNFSQVQLQKNGTYKSTITGKLTIHNVTKDVSVSATFVVNGQKINGKAEFETILEDYNIERPSIVGMKIAEKVKIMIDVTLEPLKK